MEKTEWAGRGYEEYEQYEQYDQTLPTGRAEYQRFM